MTDTEFAALTPGQAVRTLRSRKIYIYNGGSFTQWRTDRAAYFGALRRLKAEAVERASEYDTGGTLRPRLVQL